MNYSYQHNLPEQLNIKYENVTYDNEKGITSAATGAIERTTKTVCSFMMQHIKLMEDKWS